MSDVEGDEGLGGFTNIIVNDCPAEVIDFRVYEEQEESSETEDEEEEEGDSDADDLLRGVMDRAVLTPDTPEANAEAEGKAAAEAGAEAEAKEEAGVEADVTAEAEAEVGVEAEAESSSFLGACAVDFPVNYCTILTLIIPLRMCSIGCKGVQ
jgi:hypothetical protein